MRCSDHEIVATAPHSMSASPMLASKVTQKLIFYNESRHLGFPRRRKVPRETYYSMAYSTTNTTFIKCPIITNKKFKQIVSKGGVAIV